MTTPGEPSLWAKNGLPIWPDQLAAFQAQAGNPTLREKTFDFPWYKTVLKALPPGLQPGALNRRPQGPNYRQPFAWKVHELVAAEIEYPPRVAGPPNKPEAEITPRQIPTQPGKGFPSYYRRHFTSFDPNASSAPENVIYLRSHRTSDNLMQKFPELSVIACIARTCRNNEQNTAAEALRMFTNVVAQWATQAALIESNARGSSLPPHVTRILAREIRHRRGRLFSVPNLTGNNQ